MKYSIIMVKSGSHILPTMTLRSVEKHLHPDEIIVVDHKFRYSKRGGRHGTGVNRGIELARNDLCLILDHDMIFVNDRMEKEMIRTMSFPDVFCCGPIEFIDGKRTNNPKQSILPPGLALKKSMLDKVGRGFDCTGNPAFLMNYAAQSKGLKTIKLNVNDDVFHLGYACRYHYPSIVEEIKKQFNIWQRNHKNKVNLDDYLLDDGMDYNDHDWLNHTIMHDLITCINRKEPFSNMRLGDLSLRYLAGYLWNPKDFTHVGSNHNDVAMPNDEIGRQMVEDTIKYMNQATWVDHPRLYKGIFWPLFNWRGPLGRADEIYGKLGMKNKKFCCSIQSYLAFEKNFEIQFPEVIKNRRILYVGPHNDFGTYIERANIKLDGYDFYQLSMSADHMKRYNVMKEFFNKYKKPQEYDLVVVTGSVYGRVIIGGVHERGGRAWDMGQAIRFFPNNVFETVITAGDNQTTFEIVSKIKYEDSDLYSRLEQKGIKVTEI